MGLKVSTIARLPVAQDRDYFIYFLDYGWDEPLTKAMYDNFERMALFASEHRSNIAGVGIDLKKVFELGSKYVRTKLSRKSGEVSK